MNNIIKFRKKRSWVKDLILTSVVAVMIGVMLGRWVPEDVLGGFMTRADLKNETHGVITGNISGNAYVIDGDTIKINGTRIRLHGIDAPELHQNCWKESDIYSCGLDAKAYLQNLINHNSVICQTIDRDHYGRDVAKCYNYENIEINAEMVLSGNAVAYLKYSLDYAVQEMQARYQKSGIWGGHFIEPQRYRKMKNKRLGF